MSPRMRPRASTPPERSGADGAGSCCRWPPSTETGTTGRGGVANASASTSGSAATFTASNRGPQSSDGAGWVDDSSTSTSPLTRVLTAGGRSTRARVRSRGGETQRNQPHARGGRFHPGTSCGDSQVRGGLRQLSPSPHSATWQELAERARRATDANESHCRRGTEHQVRAGGADSVALRRLRRGRPTGARVRSCPRQDRLRHGRGAARVVPGSPQAGDRQV